MIPTSLEDMAKSRRLFFIILEMISNLKNKNSSYLMFLKSIQRFFSSKVFKEIWRNNSLSNSDRNEIIKEILKICNVDENFIWFWEHFQDLTSMIVGIADDGHEFYVPKRLREHYENTIYPEKIQINKSLSLEELEEKCEKKGFITLNEKQINLLEESLHNEIIILHSMLFENKLKSEKKYYYEVQGIKDKKQFLDNF